MAKDRYRTLLTGKKVREHKEGISLDIITHCPRKWAFVDLEVGNVWLIDSLVTKDYKLADDETKAAIHKLTAPMEEEPVLRKKRCKDCGGYMHWCSICEVWSQTCCIQYGTCQCS